MKSKLQKSFIRLTCIFIVFVALACSSDEDNKRATNYIPYTDNEIYISLNIDKANHWLTNSPEDSYIKIKDEDATPWFDIVITDKNKDTSSDIIMNKNLYVHVTNDMVKKFAYQDTVTFTEGFKIIYFENERLEGVNPVYDLYLVNASGILKITYNDGKNMSGNFVGKIYDAKTSKQLDFDFQFNLLPIQLTGNE